MSDDHKDVLIAAYLFEDLAKTDFDAVLKLTEDKAITVEGVVLVQKDAEGEVHVQETGDHLGRKGAKVGGGVGLVVGLFAPPLLAATAVGAAAAVSPRQCVNEKPWVSISPARMAWNMNASSASAEYASEIGAPDVPGLG